MARDIDDVIAYVNDHPGFAPVIKLLLIRRLEKNPTQVEIDAAKLEYELERARGRDGHTTTEVLGD